MKSSTRKPLPRTHPHLISEPIEGTKSGSLCLFHQSHIVGGATLSSSCQWHITFIEETNG